MPTVTLNPPVESCAYWGSGTDDPYHGTDGVIVDANVDGGYAAVTRSTSRAFFRFDLSSIPASAVVTSATLRLYAQTVTDDIAAQARRITSAWAKSDTSAPSDTTTGSDGFFVETAGYKDFAVTSIVAGWHDGTFTNHGFSLHRTFGPSSGFSCFWYSTFSATTSRWPELVVTYELTNEPPLAPTITNPAAGQALARGEVNRIGAQFNDPDASDSQSRTVGEIRLAGAAEPYYTWDDETPNEFHDVPANELTIGDNEVRAKSYDQVTDGPFSGWVPFTVAERSGPPTIISPTNGATIPSDSFEVVISASSLEATRWRRYADDDGTIDTDEVYEEIGDESASTRRKTLQFPENGRWEWIAVRRKLDGLWSEEAQNRNFVSYTEPATPTTAVVVHQVDVDGRMVDAGFAVTATHPEPVDPEPAVGAMDVWRAVDDGTGQPVAGTEERLAAYIAPSATFIDLTVASGTPHLYRVQARGENGVKSWSPWAG